MTEQQHEETLLNAGWTQWVEEMADGRKVKLASWRYQGASQWYFNDINQAEYINLDRKYTLAQACHIEELLQETAGILAQRKAEADRKLGISGQAPAAFKGARISDGPSFAEQAAREAETAEAVAT